MAFDDQLEGLLQRYWTSLLPPHAFWRMQWVVWGAFASIILLFYWPSIETLSAFETLTLKIALSVLASFLLHPVCRYIWRRRAHFALLASLAVCGGAVLAVINEAIIDQITGFFWNAPEKPTFHATLTASLRYQFALAAWCIGYFAIKFFNQVSQQRELIRRVKALQQEGHVAAFRYQLPRQFLVAMLSGIEKAIAETDGETASRLIAQFRELLCTILERPDEPFVRFSQELIHTQKYLELRATLYGPEIDFQFEVAEYVQYALIPRWFLVPLLDGLLQSRVPNDFGTPSVRVIVRLSGERLKISLTSFDGAWRNVSAVSADAINVLRSLLDAVYEGDASLVVNESSGVKFMIDMPSQMDQRGA